jgi:hypothetical protein
MRFANLFWIWPGGNLNSFGLQQALNTISSCRFRNIETFSDFGKRHPSIDSQQVNDALIDRIQVKNCYGIGLVHETDISE